MIRRIRLITFFLFIYVTISFSQSSAYENQVTRIISRIPKGCLVIPAGLPDTSVIINCSGIVNNDLVKLRLNVYDKKVNNVGFAVFSDQQLLYDNTILYFIERLMLDIFTLNDQQLIDKRLSELQTKVLAKSSLMAADQQAGASEIYSFRKNIEEIIVNRDSLNYDVTLKQKDSGILNFYFPADIQLISGMDKVELDLNLERQIRNFRSPRSDSAILADLLINKTLIPYRQNVFKISGPQFSSLIIPDVYIKKENDKFSFLFDKSHPKESITNLFLVPVNSDQNINLEWRIYGGSTNSVKLRLNDFVGYFSQNRFRNYIGFEKSGKDTLAATIIYYNPEFNYLHLLYVSSTYTGIFNSKNSIKGKFYTYIPTNNIKDLFKSYKPGNLFKITP